MRARRGWWLAGLVAAGFAWRLVAGSRVVVPREDGVNYLWMAERFAAGDAAAALGEVFSPLLALLIAVPVACGVEPFVAGQLVLALTGALAVVPMALVSERLAPGSLLPAAVLTFAASRLVLLGTQIYTEPLFLPIAAWAFHAGLRSRWWTCGALTGLAFWVRPEAAVIPLAFFGRDRTTWACWRALVPAGAAVVVLATWRGLCGHGYDPVPKLAFIAAHNVAGQTDAAGFVLRSVAHLAWIPVRLLEAFPAVACLAVVGALRGCRPAPALRLLAMAVVVICLYVPRWRFLVGWMFTLVPLAAAGVGRLPRTALWLGAVVVLDVVLALTGGVEADRVAEREVAAHLRARLAPGEVIAGDMTRVLYFAGQRPLAPRHFTADELIEAGRSARFVVLRERRETTPGVVAGLPGHERYALPDALAAGAAQRGILVLRRR